MIILRCALQSGVALRSIDESLLSIHRKEARNEDDLEGSRAPYLLDIVSVGLISCRICATELVSHEDLLAARLSL